MGVTNLAVSSDADIFSNAAIEYTRKRYAKLRTALQRCGSKSAKRHLQKTRGRQQRFQKNTNHVISKQLVDGAKDTNCSIKVENLTYIGTRTTVRGVDNRASIRIGLSPSSIALSSTKQECVGLRLQHVDPRHTSQRCFACGHIEKANRQTQATFLCCLCGHSAHADVNAAKNIAFWAAVNPPIVATRPSWLG